jgi:Family of unknown function (DUF5686)/CarboxypepD_reg-like domain
MKKIAVIVLLLCSLPILAQVRGTVTGKNGTPIAFTSVAVQGTYNGTSANENGQYTLAVSQKGTYTFVFRSIGYKTKEITQNITRFPYVLNVTLEDESYRLNEVVISNKQHLADSIIAFAIANRSKNAAKTAQFEADFYSRGNVRLTDVPDKILGQRLGDLGGSLDTTGSGIIYLSETVSKIKFSKGKLNEHVLASQVSGEDSGFSYNNADAAQFDFYQNYLPFEVSVISPIANDALNYYKYELESAFYAENGQLINKIKVTPKTDTEATMNGYIYLVDKTGELYATDLSVKGSTIKQPLLNTLTISQSFGYNNKEKLWSKNVQLVTFDMSLLSVRAAGIFSYVYSNYSFKPEFTDTSLSAEIQYFEPGSNMQTAQYWNGIRPIPLTPAERNDYLQKGKLEDLRQTKSYQDSIDSQKNRFKWTSIPLGYTHHNTPEKYDIKYTGIATRLAFNTVQAYWLGPGFEFTKYHDNNTYTKIGTDLNYGFAEQRFRATGHVEHLFNNFSKRKIILSGGSAIEQYNPEKPINKIVNSISTLFFRDNYMKLYDNAFVRLNYEEEVLNGLYLYGSAEYTRRHALRNNTDFSTLKDIYHDYTSNNPLLPYDYDTPAFNKHNMVKASIMAKISFGQTYRTRPDGRETITNDKYPLLFLKYEKGFASSIKDYEFNHVSAKVLYDLSFGKAGTLGTAFRAGKFFDSGTVAFPDWKHFNGNETHVGRSERYLNVFNLLPYYTHSTNDQYFEAHLEHHFNGYLTNSVPFFSKLEYYLVAGAHYLATPENKPYAEFTIGLDNVGWGKFRLLRFDYIRSYEGGFRGDGVVFGLTFIDFLE